MTFLKSIPLVTAVQAISRNGARHQDHNPDNTRHAFAARGQDLPEKDPEMDIDQQMLANLLSEVEEKHSQLKFELHESLNRILVSVIDRETGELIRQIPGEAAIATAEHLKEIEAGELKAGAFLNSTT